MEEKTEKEKEKRRKIPSTWVGERKQQQRRQYKDNSERGTLCPSETSAQ